MIINITSEIKSQSIFYYFDHFVRDSNLYLKFEGLNTAESIKMKTAKFLISGLEKQGKLVKGVSKVIESSSGNLGIALSIICKEKGYAFTCVTDPNILPSKEKRIKFFGAKIIKVTDRDESDGYLATRINTINSLLGKDKHYVWTNQYANQSNIDAHFSETGPEILSEIPEVDYLFIGAGTTGTLMGCAKYFKQHSPCTRIIAVDASGSVTFGNSPKKRYIPGIGTSRKPEIVDPTLINEIVLVEEKDTVKMCWHLLKHYCLFLGGSSGSVMHAIQSFRSNIKPGSNIVAISPDFGGHYQDTVYNEEWLKKYYPDLDLQILGE